jgi:ATP-binding protein involved in chromosome partitioning
MYRKLNVPVIGLIENMSHFECARCGQTADIFGSGGGERLATDLSVPFLGRIPLDATVRQGGDAGVPIVAGQPDAPASRALVAAAERVAQQVSIASYSRRAIPLTPVG